MEWSPLIVVLTIVYFLVASVTTFDIRLTQAKRAGTLTPDEPTLPAWVGHAYYRAAIVQFEPLGGCETK